MPQGTSLHVVDLKPGSKEYKDVVFKFEQTVPKAATGTVQPQYSRSTGFVQPQYSSSTGTGYSSILQIQRIQNLVLYSQYMAKKKEMDKNNKPGHQNEVHLFHGTAPDTCPKINQQGFNRSFSGKNGEFGLRLGYKPPLNIYCSDKLYIHSYMYVGWAVWNQWNGIVE
jgi:hypothetical protein